MEKRAKQQNVVQLTPREMLRRRDQFASAMLTGVMSTPLAEMAINDPIGAEKTADLCVRFADALLARLSVPIGGGLKQAATDKE